MIRSDETKTIINNFFLRSDISYTAPGMKELMCVWTTEGKVELTKHYMTMTVKEAHYLYREVYANTPHDVKLSAFASLRPVNVILLANTPQDACKCRIHENLFLQLNAMGNAYQDFWDAVLCNIAPNSPCWLSSCEACKNGKKFIPTKIMASTTTLKHWEIVMNDKDSKNIQFSTKDMFVGEVLDIFQKKI